MKRHLREQDEIFSSYRNNILENLQIVLAYLFRRRKAKRLEEERKSELARTQQAEDDRVRLQKEKRLKQR